MMPEEHLELYIIGIGKIQKIKRKITLSKQPVTTSAGGAIK